MSAVVEEAQELWVHQRGTSIRLEVREGFLKEVTSQLKKSCWPDCGWVW